MSDPIEKHLRIDFQNEFLTFFWHGMCVIYFFISYLLFYKNEEVLFQCLINHVIIKFKNRFW